MRILALRMPASISLFTPGPNETFCQAVQEALSSGTPCIVPQTGGPADLVTTGATGYIIDTSDAQALAASVEHFIARSDRAEMSLLARDSVATRTWDAINQQLIGHYKAVIESRHGALHPVGAVA